MKKSLRYKFAILSAVVIPIILVMSFPHPSPPIPVKNVEVIFRGNAFSFPKQYVDHVTHGTYLSGISLHIPVDELPIIDREDNTMTVISIELEESSESLPVMRSRYIDAKTYTNKTLLKNQKNGFIIFSRSHSTPFWSEVMVVPADETQQIFFTCNAPDEGRNGISPKGLCRAHTNMNNPSPDKMKLEYPFSSTKLDEWQAVDKQVKKFIDRFRIPR
jgi:hypothetical protein